MKDPIEIKINCYECSPHQFEDAVGKLSEAFKEYDTEDLDCVQWPDFNQYGYATVQILDIPDDKLDWAYEQIDEAMEDISSWSVE